MALSRFIAANGIDANSKTLINVADPVNAQDVSTKNFSSNANNLVSGVLSVARLPALTGDVTAAAGTGALTLAASGVTAGTFTKFTVDAKGRVTSGSSLLASDIPNLDWTKISTGLPTTLAGYGITNAVVANAAITASTFAKITFDSKGLVTAGSNLVASDIPSLDASKVITGSFTSAQMPAFTGDATSTAGTSTLTLANSGVTTGTYKSVTVDAKGRVTSGSNPTTLAGFGITDAYTKAEVDGLVTGLDFKNSVRAISTTNISLTGTQTVDGVALNVGDRILVAGQTAAAENGIYVVAAGAWSRAADANTSATVTSGLYTFVESGTVNSDTGWVLATDGAVTVGTTALSFTQFNGAAQIIAGAGITKTGNTLDIVGTAGRIIANADSVDLASVTQSGTGSFVKVTLDSYGRVTGNTAVAQADITGLLGPASISNTMLANTAVANLSGTNTGDETVSTIKTKLGITTLSGSNTGDQTITLTGDVTGSGTGSFAATLANSGATAGTYRSVTVDAKGRVTTGTNPTTLAGYGITDAQPLDNDLSAIAALAGTSGILRKTATDTWTLDTSTYLTSNQSITISGDASGTGTTAITLTFANSGVTAGTYKSVTVDAKGRVTSGSNPTTLAGFGITDALNNTSNVTIPLIQGDISSATLTTSTVTVNQVLDSISATMYRTVKYLVQVTSGAAYAASEILVIHNGTTASVVEYGNVATGAALATFDADVTGGNLRLLASPVNAASTFRVMRITLDV